MTHMSGLLFRAPGSWRDAPGNGGACGKKREAQRVCRLPCTDPALILMMRLGAVAQRGEVSGRGPMASQKQSSV